MKKIAWVLFSIWWLVACQQELPVAEENKEGGPIYLSAVVESQTASRAPYTYTVPNSTNAGKLYTTVLASSVFENGAYSFKHVEGNNGEHGGMVSIHTDANFESETPQLLANAVYPPEGTPVYFIGLHPQNTWNVNDAGTQASLTIDGSQDAMFAPRIEGTYAQDDQLNTEQFTFKHLLTWLRIKIKAEDEATAASGTTIKAWGKIKNMKITSKNQIMIDLSAVTNNTLECVSYSESTGYTGFLPIRYVKDDTEFPGTEGYELKPEWDEVAYVLCTPVNATETVYDDNVNEDVETAEYTLHIETENRTVGLPIDLKKNDTEYFTGNTRSHFFTLALNFKMGNTIVITATLEVSDWQYGGTGTGDIDY